MEEYRANDQNRRRGCVDDDRTLRDLYRNK
jgi:hypothetical protein